MRHFVEWDTFDLRVDGERLNAMVQAMAAGNPPLEKLRLRFRNGLLLVEGSVRKFISVPFTVHIREFQASGTTVRVPLKDVAAAGIPVPSILFGLIKSRLPRDLVRWEEPNTLVFSLDRFLPPFVSADVQKIWIIDGGLAIQLGRGGADPPMPTEERHGYQQQVQV